MSGEELVEAAARGDLSEVRALLERGAQINSKSGLFVSLFCTVLLSSERVSSVSLLSSLLHFFRLFSSLLSSSLLFSHLLFSFLVFYILFPPFSFSVSFFSLSLTVLYIFPNIYILKGRTALHEAADNGHLEVARLLIDRSADINMKNNYVTIL